MVRNYASSVGAQVFETSSKTGKGVDELFFGVAEAALKRSGRLNSSGLEKSTVSLDKHASSSSSSSQQQQGTWWSRWC
jgi:hypothetical protein